MSKTVKVTLQGKTFTLQTEEDEAHIQASAALVNDRIDALRKKAGLPEGTLAMLVGMELAGELLKSQGTGERFLPLKLRAERLRDRLKSSLASRGAGHGA
jgi:cell division protein ZapA (FtsZ GTPase activity inhibitor)